MPDSAALQRHVAPVGEDAVDRVRNGRSTAEDMANRLAGRKPPMMSTIVAAGQLAGLVLIVLIDLVADSRVAAISVGQIVNAIILLAGFSLAVHHWMYREKHGYAAMAGEIVERVALVAGVILLSAIVATKVGGGVWYELHLARTLAVMLVIVSAGAVAPLVADYVAQNHYLARAKNFTRDRATPRRIVVFGDDEPSFALAQRLRAQLRTTDICLYPTASLRAHSGSPECMVNPFYADPRLIELAPDVAVIASPAFDPQTVAKIVLDLAPLSVDVLMNAAHSELWGPGPLTVLAGVPFVRLFPRPLRWHQQVLKRACDIVVSAVLVLVLLPLLCAVAIAIKFDSPGPVLFRQPRIGRGGAHFTVYKFRSMRGEAADVLADQLTRRNDPRVTRLGAFLRKSSIDELPQLLNVLFGNMSLVGPRPHALNAKASGDMYSAVVRNYHARHRVRPGITGLAQVEGWRGPTDTHAQIEQRVANDVRYIDEWSLFGDFVIMVRTAFALFGKNAL